MISVVVCQFARFYKAGSLVQMEMEVIARSRLVAVPGNLVALRFPGLALHRMGRVDDACLTCKRVAATPFQQEKQDDLTVCELAHAAILGAATAAHSGPGGRWRRNRVSPEGIRISHSRGPCLRSCFGRAAGVSSVSSHPTWFQDFPVNESRPGNVRRCKVIDDAHAGRRLAAT